MRKIRPRLVYAKVFFLLLLLPIIVLLIKTYSLHLRLFMRNSQSPADAFLDGRTDGLLVDRSPPVVRYNTSNIIWVIPSTSQAWSLDLTLNSMKNIGTILLSREPDRTDIDAVVEKYPYVVAVDTPHSCTTYGKIHDGNRLKLSLCAKNNWWMMMRKAWELNTEVVCVTNENIVIHPMAAKWLNMQLLNADIGVKLTSHGTVPWCMSRKIWNGIESTKDMFCMKKGDWDVTIAEILSHGSIGIENRAFIPSKDFSLSLKECIGPDLGSCSDEKKENIRGQVANWALEDRSDTMTITDTWMTTPFAESWDMGQLNEHAHCRGLCKGFQFKPTADQRVYINQPPKGGDAYLMDLGPTCLDMSKVHVSMGGENVRDVMNRPEDEEFPRYEKGAWTMNDINILADPKHYQSKILRAVAAWDKPPSEFDITGTTIAYQRIEYANVCLTTIDWFNLYLTLQHISSNRVLWLDGHAVGHLDEVWSKLFPIEIQRMGKLSGKVCFERIVLMPKVSPLYDTKMFGGCDFFDFMRQMLRAYNVTSNGPKHDTVIIRDYYLAHPRVTSFVDRKLDEGSLAKLRKILPGAKFVRFHELSWRDQLQLVLNTKTLYGIHGAGSMFGLFMEPGSKLVEWVVDSRRYSYGFQHMMTWRPDVRYERIDLKIWLKKHKPKK